MGYIEQFIIGFVVGLSGAMIPGPLLVFTVSRTMRGNVWTSVKIIMGHAIVEFFLVIVILIWLTQIQKIDVIGIIISLVGGAAITLFGILMILNASKYTLPKRHENSMNSTSVRGDISGGAFFSAFNAAFPLWWLTAGALMVASARKLGILGVIFFMAGHWLSDIGWYALIGFGVVKGRRILKDNIYQIILRILGVGLALFGIYFLISPFKSHIF